MPVIIGATRPALGVLGFFFPPSGPFIRQGKTKDRTVSSDKQDTGQGNTSIRGSWERVADTITRGHQRV